MILYHNGSHHKDLKLLYESLSTTQPMRWRLHKVVKGNSVQDDQCTAMEMEGMDGMDGMEIPYGLPQYPLMLRILPHEVYLGILSDPLIYLSDPLEMAK